jgi:large subunit ribosomal protein L15
MDLSSLKPAKGAVKKGKRIGRGQGSGRGGTSTRGHKGAGSRSGTSYKAGFEGGQMPIQRRVPKFGFKNPNRVEFTPINLSTLQELSDKFGIKQFDAEVLRQHGLLSKKDKVKILAKGELTAALDVKAHAFSKSAASMIESKGGKTENIA